MDDDLWGFLWLVLVCAVVFAAMFWPIGSWLFV